MDPFVIAFSLLAVLAGAVLRGFTGFGSSLVWVSSLSLILPPVAVVPTTFALEIAASAHLLPKVRNEVDWRSLRWLLLGAVAATPVGLYALAALPAAPVRIAISLVVLLATLLIWRGFALKAMPGAAATLATGVLAGLLNGGAGIGGPPAILFYFSGPAAATVSRASLIAFFLVTDLFAIAVAAGGGLVTGEVMVRTAILIPVVILGAAIGQRGFLRADPEFFRRATLILLAALSIALVLRVVVTGS